MKLRWIIIITLFLASCSSTGPVTAPPRQAFIGPTQFESEQLKVGARYHDNKQYVQAIKQYKLILAKNPQNPVALYELALTYYTQNDFMNSLQYTKAAADFKSPFLANVYLLMGLNYKKLNQPDQALLVYQFATNRFEAHIDLHYQLAASYLALSQPGKAAEVFKKIIRLNPYHHDSHFQLGLAYYLHDYKTPALLSLMTFLLLEPDSKRSPLAISLIDDIFKSGVTIDDKTKETTLAVNPDSKTDEGDFRLIDIVMSTRRIELLTSEHETDELHIKPEQLKSYLLALSQIKTTKTDQYFIQQHYFPFYKLLLKRNLTNALFYYTHQSTNKRKINNWISTNQKQITKVKVLFKEFMWGKR